MNEDPNTTFTLAREGVHFALVLFSAGLVVAAGRAYFAGKKWHFYAFLAIYLALMI